MCVCVRKWLLRWNGLVMIVFLIVNADCNPFSHVSEYISTTMLCVYKSIILTSDLFIHHTGIKNFGSSLSIE